jgi:hypothetical protein
MNDQASEAQALFESLDPLAQTAILDIMRSMAQPLKPFFGETNVNLLTSA